MAAEQKRENQTKRRAGQDKENETAFYRFRIRGKRIKTLAIPVKAPEEDAREDDGADDKQMQIRPETDRTGLVRFVDGFYGRLRRFIERDRRRYLLRIVGLDKLRCAKPRRTGGCLTVGAEPEGEIDIALLCAGTDDQCFARPVKAAGTSGTDGIRAVKRVIIDRKTHAAPAVDALGGDLRRKAVYRIRLDLDHLTDAHIVFRSRSDDERAILRINGIILRFVCHGIPPVRNLRQREIRIG